MVTEIDPICALQAWLVHLHSLLCYGLPCALVGSVLCTCLEVCVYICLQMLVWPCVCVCVCVCARACLHACVHNLFFFFFVFSWLKIVLDLWLDETCKLVCVWSMDGFRVVRLDEVVRGIDVLITCTGKLCLSLFNQQNPHPHDPRLHATLPCPYPTTTHPQK